MKKQLISTCISLCVSMLCLGASAQTTALKDSQVTETALIDALALDAPEFDPDEAKTRGFRLASPRAPAKVTNPNAGKVNLLITFPSNSANLTSGVQTMLDTLARALESDKLAGFGFKVEGHADAMGDIDNNTKLSLMRAESVANYLVAKHSILPERLTAIGKGSSELLNKTQLDAPENRRVTIVTVKN